MKRHPNEEPSLFDEPEEEIFQTEDHPRWEYHSILHMDFLADEAVVAFTYSLEVLESRSGDYSSPVLTKLMNALSALSTSRWKGLRNQAFTIFCGDIIESNAFVVAISAKTAKSVDFIAPYLRGVPGHEFVEAATSRRLLPLYRYDNGYVIEYSDEGLEGTHYIDTSENLGSGLTIYRRIWRPAEDLPSSRSIYGQLVHKP